METKPKLGTGERFAALKAKLTKRNVYKPDALAAWIGMKKYGKKHMAEMAAKGHKEG